MNYNEIQRITKELQKVEKKRENLKCKYAQDFDKLNCEIETLQDELVNAMCPTNTTNEVAETQE